MHVAPEASDLPGGPCRTMPRGLQVATRQQPTEHHESGDDVAGAPRTASTSGVARVWLLGDVLVSTLAVRDQLAGGHSTPFVGHLTWPPRTVVDCDKGFVAWCAERFPPARHAPSALGST
jgi:hypothetical protein